MSTQIANTIAPVHPILLHSSTITLDEYLEVTALVFNWADSYDAKDWPRLASIIAPTLLVDYTGIGKAHWPAMSASDFMAMVTSLDFLGDPCIKTQHHIGATQWVKISPDFIIGYHQLRAAHQVYENARLEKVKLKGHSHATNEHYYRRGEDGKWKFAGLKPTVRWNEYAFENVFKGSFVKSRL